MVSERDGAICEHIKTHGISLVANKIDDKGAAALSEALMVNTSLRKLHISGEKISHYNGKGKNITFRGSFGDRK